jgi:hypothetical protein
MEIISKKQQVSLLLAKHTLNKMEGMIKNETT